jgi:3-oxoadipate enol-lactonase
MNPSAESNLILDREGCPLHYWLSGPQNRPLVVFTHGAGVDHHEFDATIEKVSAEYRVLTWDVRAHGQSRPAGAGFTMRRATEDLIALLDHLGVQQAILVGHSMGGNIGQEVVFNHPERVLALALLGCTCNTFKLTDTEKFWVKAGIPLLYVWPFLRRQSAFVSATTQPARDAIFQAMKQISVREFADIMGEVALCLHEEPGYRITQPLLLAHGAQDQTGNIRAVAPKWAAREPDCHYTVIPNAGHAANLDNPVFFDRLLIDFLHRVAPPV